MPKLQHHLQKPSVRRKRNAAIAAANALKRKWRVTDIKRARMLEASSQGGKAAKAGVKAYRKVIGKLRSARQPSSEHLEVQADARLERRSAGSTPRRTVADHPSMILIGLREKNSQLLAELERNELRFLKNFYKVVCSLAGER